MKLCFVSTEYPPETHFGGIATFLQNTTRILARRGHEVSVVSITRQPKDRFEEIDGVKIWRFSELKKRSHPSDDLRRCWQVWRAVEQIQPEVVQLMDWQAEGFLLALLNRNKYGLVTRLTHHGTVTKGGNAYTYALRRKLLSFMGYQQIIRSHALISPSVQLARQAERDSGLASGTIRQIATCLPLDEMQAFRQTEPILKISGPYLVYFGRLEERKGIRYLAEALPLVWQKFSGLKMVFIGRQDFLLDSGKMARTYIEERAGQYLSRLIFIEHLSRAELLPIVARAKLAVLPSIWENYANACLEAIALGVPVITTGDSGGNVEIVAGQDDPETELGSVPAGWLVPHSNAPALASAIIEALSDEEAYRQVLQNVQKRALRFDAERMVDKLEALYREVIDRKARDTERNKQDDF